MLIDMHAHTSGISKCCRAEASVILQTAREAGINGLVLTNHYDKSYVGEDGAPAFAGRYVDEFYYTKKLADEMNFPLFFGIEVTACLYNNAHILLYGLPPEFILEHPEIYSYTLEQMENLAHKRGGLIIQAHPFRGGGHILDTKWLDGIEVNCHPVYDATHCAALMEIAATENLLVTCGGDYHADTPYRAVCGVHFPDNTGDWASMILYLKETNEIRLHVHELRCIEHSDVTFLKPSAPDKRTDI